MSGLAHHYRSSARLRRRPAGSQPRAWVQARAASSTPVPVTDYRTSPPAGLLVGGGSLKVGASYGGSKLAYLLDGSTPITVSGLELAGTQQLTVLMSVQFSNHASQYYLFTYGAGTNYDDHSFDTYSNNSQLIYRAREAPGTQTSSFIGYMNAPGTPSTFALVADYTKANPHSTIEPQHGTAYPNTGNPIPLTWADYVLTLTQGVGGAIPLPAGSQLRYCLVFDGTLTLEKCQEWIKYLDTLP